MMTRFRPLLALLAVATLFTFVAVEIADAKMRSGIGSRGTRTYQAPAATNTAPNSARPIERSMTQPGTPGAAAQPSTVGRPATPAAQPGGLLNRPGLLGGLAAGFLGAGLIGLLMGNGLLGGLGGLASFFGLLLQVGLVAIVAMLAWRWWQSRQQPAMAGGPSLRDIASGPRGGLPGSLGSLAGLGGGSAPAPAKGGDEIGLTAQDFDTFERLLGEIQVAYGREDLVALRANLTPEMLSYYAEDLAENAKKGVTNEISDVKLLQGDIAEAWREGNDEYATLAMRYAHVDRIIDRATGRVVEGSAAQPSETTELWTFRRERGGPWLLSATQEA